MEIADTNVLVAALNTRDSLHVRAIAALTKAQRPIAIPEYVALETATVLMRTAGKKTADTFVRSLFATQDLLVLPASPEQFVAASECFLEEQKLSFVDASLLALSHTHHIITFDTALSRAIGKNKK